jgi:hypothetical protein
MDHARILPGQDQPRPPVWQRLGWFVLIWSASILALGVVAYGIRAVLK